MKIQWTPTTRRLPGPWWAWAIVGAWLRLAGLAGWLAASLGHQAPLCVFKRLTALPCPTCGLTRGCLRLLSGDVAGAWLCNPLMFSAASVAAALLLWKAACGRKLQIALKTWEKFAASAIAVTLSAANWVYVIRYVG